MSYLLVSFTLVKGTHERDTFRASWLGYEPDRFTNHSGDVVGRSASASVRTTIPQRSRSVALGRGHGATTRESGAFVVLPLERGWLSSLSNGAPGPDAGRPGCERVRGPAGTTAAGAGWPGGRRAPARARVDRDASGRVRRPGACLMISGVLALPWRVEKGHSQKRPGARQHPRPWVATEVVGHKQHADSLWSFGHAETTEAKG
jgi:hypothetical protein